MQVSVETTSGLERRITVGIPAEVVDKEVKKRLSEAAKTIRINGFRKGKVPLKVVKQHYGAGVRQEVLGDTINRSFYEAVQKESIRPAGQPNIQPKQLEEGKDIEFVATFEVYPSIELQGTDGIEVTRYDADISEDDVTKIIETLQKNQAAWEPVDRKSKLDDQVNINFLGQKDGEPFDGGKGENVDLVLGSKQMIPGFEDGLVGVKADETRSLELTFPEDYQAEELRGADVVFEVSVNSVSARKLPEIDDAFFEKFGVTGGDEEKFRSEVKENMEREKEIAKRSKLKDQLMDALLAANKVESPKSLLSAEIDALRQQTVQQYGGAAEGLDLKSILPDDMFKERAEKRVALGLVVSEVVTQNKLKADKDVVRRLIEEAAASYEEPEAVVQQYYSNENLLQSVEAAALEEAVVELLLSKANVTDASVSYEEVIKPLPSVESES